MNILNIKCLKGTKESKSVKQIQKNLCIGMYRNYVYMLNFTIFKIDVFQLGFS